MKKSSRNNLLESLLKIYADKNFSLFKKIPSALEGFLFFISLFPHQNFFNVTTGE